MGSGRPEARAIESLLDFGSEALILVSPTLSDREMAVLELLPTLLTAREIAAEFTVSVNTVKSHIRSIYAKLGVSSRRDAVLRAQDRGLLPSGFTPGG